MRNFEVSFHFFFYFSVLYSRGIFKKTIISPALVLYEMIITNSALRDRGAIYHRVYSTHVMGATSLEAFFYQSHI